MIEKKKCTKCGEEKALTEFFKNPTGRFGRLSRCKLCVYELRNLEKRRAESAKWRANNIEKARNRIARITNSYVADLLRIPVAECPPELLEIKREQLRLRRLTKQLKQEIQNV